MTKIQIRDVSLFVKIMGKGHPLLLMHGGPGLDYTTLLPLQPLADQFTLIFYDHRCNGRSQGVDVSSMTFDNLAADADALRQKLGFDRWAVLGHSFGGNVALEYALRYPQSLSHLILMDTGGDQWWVSHNAPELLAKRGYSASTVQAARRFYNGRITPGEFLPTMMKFMSAYNYRNSLLSLVQGVFSGHMPNFQPEALIFGYRQLLQGWTVMGRLGEIRAPTLVMAGRFDFLFPTEHQVTLAAGIPNARLEIIERAGHNPHMERQADVLEAIRRFMPSANSAKATASRTPYDAVDAHIEGQMRRLKIPGAALAIVEGEQSVHLRGFGRARPGGETPTPQTPFFIGSLTKSFTAVAVMQLVEAGKIELDAPVQRYLSWFRVADPQASAQMTVRHLLNQTSGLPNSSGEIILADFDAAPDAAERQVRALSSLVLKRPVGSAWEYSNSNYQVLGLIVEAASGEPYADYIQQHVFDPLGMRHSYTSKAAAQPDGLAVGHQYWFLIPIAAPDVPIPQGSLSAGLLISCAEDLARYLTTLLNGGRYGDVQILSPESIAELLRGEGEVNVYGQSLGRYGMGWWVDKLGQTKVAWHSGSLPDFSAYMALLPEQEKGVVLLFNADHHWMNPVFTTVGTRVTALLAGEQPQSIPFVGLIPWMLRGQLLIPALQLAGVVATLDLLRRWRRQPESRPRGSSALGRFILPSLIPNLLIALTLKPLLGKRRGYLKLYMPDYSWIAMLCGGFAVVWSLLRTGLILRALRPGDATVLRGDE